MTTNLSKPEPPPIPNNKTPVWELVIADMRERDASGRAKYGGPLQPFNGRRPLVDAYQEVLDLAVYLRQQLYETEARERVGELIQDERDDQAVALTRARELRQQAEDMCAQRTRERDAMERRALAAEASLAAERERLAPQFPELPPRYTVEAEGPNGEWIVFFMGCRDYPDEGVPTREAAIEAAWSEFLSEQCDGTWRAFIGEFRRPRGSVLNGQAEPPNTIEVAMPAADRVVEQVQSIDPQLLVEPGVCGVVWGNLSERGFDVVESFGLAGVSNEAVKELASQAATAGDWRPDGQWLAVWLRTPAPRRRLQGPWFYHGKTDIMAWMRPAWVVNKAGDLDPALVSKIAKHVFEVIGAARAKV